MKLFYRGPGKLGLLLLVGCFLSALGARTRTEGGPLSQPPAVVSGGLKEIHPASPSALFSSGTTENSAKGSTAEEKG